MFRSLLRASSSTKVLINCVQRKMASGSIFQGKGDRFRGLTISSNEEKCDFSNFPKQLEESLNQWKTEKRRTIWFKVYLDKSEWVPILANKGFKYHHAKEDYVMMCMWLPKDEPNNIPPYAHTLIGVGGIVVNEKKQILVVKEKYATRTQWKLPGGYVEPGENLVDAVMREVQEETNVTAEFQSVIAFRHTHNRVYDCSDIYMVVSMKAISAQITKRDNEISECIWMDIQEYLQHPEIHSLNKFVIEKYLEYEKKQISLDCIQGIHQTMHIPYTIYCVNDVGKKSEMEERLKIT